MSVSVRRISWSTLGLTLLGMRESNYMLTYSIGVSFTCILLVGMTKNAIQSAEVISATESVQHNNVFCNLLLFCDSLWKGQLFVTTLCEGELRRTEATSHKHFSTFSQIKLESQFTCHSQEEKVHRVYKQNLIGFMQMMQNLQWCTLFTWCFNSW